jgi:hypothetical protein
MTWQTGGMAARSLIAYLSVFQQLLGPVADRIGRDEAVPVVGLVWGRTAAETARRHISGGQLQELGELWGRAKGHPVSEGRLWELEETYCDPGLATLLASDRWLVRYPFLQQIAYVDLLDRLLTDLISPESIVLSDDVADLTSWLIYCKATSSRATYTAIAKSRLPDRVLVHGTATTREPRLVHRYRNATSDEARARLQQLGTPYLEAFRSGWTPLKLTDYLTRPSRTMGRDMGFLFVRAKEQLADPTDPTRESVGTLIGRRLMRLSRSEWRLRRMASRDTVTSGDWVFPLHYHPEAATLVRAPQYTDQIDTIRRLALSLPVSRHLVVREHPVMIGRRSMSVYHDLMRIPNVDLLAPGISSIDALGPAAGVVTLTSSLGWEAWVMGKPVVMLGDAIYTDAPGIVRIDDECEVGEATTRAADNPQSEAEITRWLGVLHEESHPGSMDHPAYSDSGSSTNVRDLTCAVRSRLAGVSCLGGCHR